MKEECKILLVTNESLSIAYRHCLIGLNCTLLSKDKEINVKIEKNVSSGET